MMNVPSLVNFQGEQRLKIHLKDQYAPKGVITKGSVDNTGSFKVMEAKTEFSPSPELSEILKNTNCPGWRYDGNDNNALVQAGPFSKISDRSILDRINDWLTSGKLENQSGNAEEKCSVFSNSNDDMAVISVPVQSPEMDFCVIDLVELSSKEYGNLITSQRLITKRDDSQPEYNEIVNTAKKIIDLKA